MAAGDKLPCADTSGISSQVREAKSLVRHGEWLAWLDANCPVGERGAPLHAAGAKSATRFRFSVGDAGARGDRRAGQSPAA
jgi:hypothetical protein